MEEKLKSPPVNTGLITMTGEVKLSQGAKNQEDSSEPVELCKTGEITLLIGHPESWLTDTAEEITDSLKGKGIVIGIFVDDFQMNLANHWGSDFR